ncbi:MAG: biotin/lipoyl-binding protein [Rhodothermales bacterium]|nr:biotin/lipoyl-binding protein [Rhodothermales bacterium]
MARDTYLIQLGDQSRNLDSDGTLVFDEEGDTSLRTRELGDGRYAVLHRGTSRLLTIESRSEDGIVVRTAAGKRSITWKDRRALLLEEMGFEAGTAAQDREVRAPMPGLVLSVMVEPGQEVSVGDGLVVLEAMKMENELRAGADGIVKRVMVHVGDAVGKDDLLIEVEA